jgi:hypothetical protein
MTAFFTCPLVLIYLELLKMPVYCSFKACLYAAVNSLSAILSMTG